MRGYCGLPIMMKLLIGGKMKNVWYVRVRSTASRKAQRRNRRHHRHKNQKFHQGPTHYQETRKLSWQKVIVTSLSKVGKILFDSGATHSFVYNIFIHDLPFPSEHLLYHLEISLLVGIKVTNDIIYKKFLLTLREHEYLTNLFKIPICEYDIVLGMDWLFRNQAQLNCYTKKVTLLGTT